MVVGIGGCAGVMAMRGLERCDCGRPPVVAPPPGVEGGARRGAVPSSEALIFLLFLNLSN